MSFADEIGESGDVIVGRYGQLAGRGLTVGVNVSVTRYNESYATVGQLLVFFD